MVDKRRHRGANPRDGENFAPDILPDLRLACSDYCFLLSRGYAETSALKLVGDHFQFTKRQRLAVYRFGCADDKLEKRLSKSMPINQLAGQTLLIDALNTIITLEAGLSGSYILKCRDLCYRDMSEVYSNYRIVEETSPAIEMIGQALEAWGVKKAVWFIDKPVSNSKRLNDLIEKAAYDNSFPWEIELCRSPDKQIIEKQDDGITVTTDRIILDRCNHWTNLAAHLIRQKIHSAIVLDLT